MIPSFTEKMALAIKIFNLLCFRGGTGWKKGLIPPLFIWYIIVSLNQTWFYLTIHDPDTIWSIYSQGLPICHVYPFPCHTNWKCQTIFWAKLTKGLQTGWLLSLITHQTCLQKKTLYLSLFVSTFFDVKIWVMSFLLEPVCCKKQQKKFLTSYWFVE